MIRCNVVDDWLPPGKVAALCLSVDDVHPAASDHNGSADIAIAALDHVRWLQQRHPMLRVTLFTTPDWRSLEPFPSRSLRRRVPVMRDHFYTVRVLRKGTYRLDRHETFCAYLRDWPGVEVALHGLHHVRRGMKPVLEFDGRNSKGCRNLLDSACSILSAARIPFVRGLSPPGWEASPALLEAMTQAGMRFIASARDLDTPVAANASTSGSGLRGVPLVRPAVLAGTSLVHLPTNFQATSTIDRAMDVLRVGGLLSIKAHLLVSAGAYRALDGLTPQYRQHLDDVLCRIEDQYGPLIWWASMAEIAERAHNAGARTSQ